MKLTSRDCVLPVSLDTDDKGFFVAHGGRTLAMDDEVPESFNSELFNALYSSTSQSLESPSIELSNELISIDSIEDTTTK